MHLHPFLWGFVTGIIVSIAMINASFWFWM